jgi:hypothetical protein
MIQTFILFISIAISCAYLFFVLQISKNKVIEEYEVNIVLLGAIIIALLWSLFYYLHTYEP